MTSYIVQYPKFLAFLQLVFPPLYNQLAQHSHKSDIVKANLTSAHNIASFSAIIFSDDAPPQGDEFKIISENNNLDPYAWDWRWVFAINLRYEEDIIFILKFKQKVIALPSGVNPLSPSFFENLQSEFGIQIQNIINDMNDKSIPISSCYSEYLMNNAS